jgi:hypothetical protein
MSPNFANSDQPKLLKKSIIVSDAETGDTSVLRQGRQLKIVCNFSFITAISFSGGYAPTVQINVDGKPVSNQKTSVTHWYSGADNVRITDHTTPAVLWDAKIVGTHTVTCSMDPQHPLGKTDATIKETFAVEAVPVYQLGDPVKPPVLSSKPAILKPDLIIFSTNTSVMPNCGLGQTVVTLNVEVKNVGLGPAFSTSDKPLKLKVDADAGLVDQEVTVSLLDPGQTFPLTMGLKPIGSPKSLAGARIKLQVAINPKNLVEESNYSNNAITVGLSFPSNFCTSSSEAAQGTPSPGSRQPSPPPSSQVPAVQKPARPAGQK